MASAAAQRGQSLLPVAVGLLRYADGVPELAGVYRTVINALIYLLLATIYHGVK